LYFRRRSRRAYRLTSDSVDAVTAEAASLRAAARVVETRLARPVTGTA
jgi:hypothetical protein